MIDGCGLNDEQLFLNLKTQHYWRAPGHIPDIAHRGYQLIQHLPQQGIDPDVTQTDALGGTVIWLAPN